MPKELDNQTKNHHSKRLMDLKIRCGAKDFWCGAKSRRERFGVKGGEKEASYPSARPCNEPKCLQALG